MSRSLTLDIVKGIGIILVVVGYCIKSYTIPGIFIYAFHMPLFFLISGICFNGEKYQVFKPFFYKRLRQLLVPAVTFSAIIVLLSYCLLGNDNLLYNLSWKGFPHAIWFLGVLFIVEIAYWLLYQLSKTKKAICLYIVLGILIGAWTSSKGLCSPYSIFSSFIALAFYALGNLIRPMVTKLSLQDFRGKYLILLGIPSFVIEIVICVINNHELMMLTNDFVPSDLIPALFGIFAVFCVSKFIESIFAERIQKVLVWLGQNTIVIMCSHILMINIALDIFKPIVHNYLLYKTTESLFVWSTVVLLSIFVNRKCKWVIGKRYPLL